METGPGYRLYPGPVFCTRGSSFRQLESLKPGDVAYIETNEVWYKYTYTGFEKVRPHNIEVLAPNPGDTTWAESTTGDRYLTLTTCTYPLSVWRIAGHFKMTGWSKKSCGVPSDLSSVYSSK